MSLLRISAGLLVVLLTGCATATGQAATTGQVAGRLLRDGGPLGPGGQQPGLRPMPGTVAFAAAGHRRVTVRVGNSGSFSVRLPPGRYQVSGPCSRPTPVTVAARRTAHIKIICVVRQGSPPTA